MNLNVRHTYPVQTVTSPSFHDVTSTNTFADWSRSFSFTD